MRGAATWLPKGVGEAGVRLAAAADTARIEWNVVECVARLRRSSSRGGNWVWIGSPARRMARRHIARVGVGRAGKEPVRAVLGRAV
jgi:hypothetical protein